MDQLKAAKAELDAAGIKMSPIDHVVTKSLYLDDPDGNTLELYVDVSDEWRREPQIIANVRPLEL
jgi:catechol 2,3-dioxygenase